MFAELKAQVESIKKEMVDLKKTHVQSSNTNTTFRTDMDDLESLFSSLDGNYSPFATPSCSDTPFSPPPLPPNEFQFQPITLSGSTSFNRY